MKQTPIGRLVAIAACLAMMFLALRPTTVAAAGDVYAADDAASETSGLPAGKALGCNPSGAYCSGSFDEMVFRIRYTDNGEIALWMQQAVIDHVSSTGFCTLKSGAYVIIPSGHPLADRYITTITVARSLGNTFRLNWAQGASGFCELNKIWDPY